MNTALQADDAGTGEIDYISYGGYAFRAIQFAFTIYNAIQSANRAEALEEALASYHAEEMAMLQKIYDAVEFGFAESNITPIQNSVVNLNKALAARDTYSKRLEWLADAYDSTTGAVALHRNFLNAMKISQEDSSFLGEFRNVLGDDHTSQGRLYYGEEFFEGLLSTVKRGQANIVLCAQILEEKRQQEESGVSVEDWDDDQFEMPGEDDFSKLVKQIYPDSDLEEELDQIRSQGESYLRTKFSNQFDDRRTYQPDPNKVIAGKATHEWTEQWVGYNRYTYSMCVAEGFAEVPADDGDDQYAVVGIELVEASMDNDLPIGSDTIDALSIRIHYAPLAAIRTLQIDCGNLPPSKDSDDKQSNDRDTPLPTVTVDTGGGDGVVAPTGHFFLDKDLHMFNGGFLGQELVDGGEDYVVVGAGIAQQKGDGPLNMPIPMMTLVLKMRKFDRETEKLVDETYMIPSDDHPSNTVELKTFFGDESESEPGNFSPETFSERFAATKSLPDRGSVLNGATLHRRSGGTTFVRLYTRFI